VSGAASPGRLIYRLEVDGNRRLRCEFMLTHLMNWRAFKRAPIRSFAELMQAKYADYLRDEDRRMVMRLIYWEMSQAPVAVIGGEEAYQLLHDMTATGRAFLGEGKQLALKWSAERPGRHAWIAQPDSTWRPGLTVEPTAKHIVASEPPCYIDQAENVAGPIRTSFSRALAAGWTQAGAMTEKEARSFCLRLLNQFPSETIPLPGAESPAAAEQIPARTCLRVRRKDSFAALETGRAYSLQELAMVEVHFAYGPRRLEWNAAAETLSFEEGGRVRRCTRDRVAEEQSLALLRGIGFRPAAAAEEGLFQFDLSSFELSPDAPESWGHILEHQFPRLRRDLSWKVEFDSGFDLISPARTQWFSHVVQTRNDWFSLEAGLVYEGQHFPVSGIIRQLLRDHRRQSDEELLETCRRSSYTVPIEGGSYLIVPGQPIAELLALLLKGSLPGGQTDALSLSAWQAAELSEAGLAEVEENPLVGRLERLRREKKDGFELAPIATLPDLPVTPRDYQLIGLGWLDFLREYGLGGILADDMGLGKTMQVLVHILREKEAGRLDGPCLIIAPTSVIDSWRSEHQRFTPGLKIAAFHGAQRQLPPGGFSSLDLVLTSYDLARLEADLFRQTTWSLLALDEAQRIKNADSETARAVCSFPAHRRLCLTGTPLENHLGELWSLFHFLMPGLLGSRKAFTRDFRQPVEGADVELARETAGWLALRLRPFILRRKKDEVARELPPRTELTRLVPLAPRQATIYESVRLRLHRELSSELEKRGLGGSQIQILDALLKLRQLCCDPRLQRDAAADLITADSAKLSLLMEMVESLLEEGRTILIFSQFVTMLRLIGRELDQRKFAYLELTGQTKNRGQVVEAFQVGQARIFLISLKAGGSGLNLTQADTVIQYDPWWNPAVERQAADRVYRIGQDKPVFHYRLIAEGTVEEKILHLQSKKQAIIDGILEGVPSGHALLDQEIFEALFAEA
jgi:hypothetical protein